VIYNFYISPNISGQVKEDDMGLIDTYAEDEKYKILIVYLYHFSDLGLVGKLILKWILTELGVGMRTGFSYAQGPWKAHVNAFLNFQDP
jgi:hypothetical protein